MVTTTQRIVEARSGVQSDFIWSKARHPALFAGRRFGKSTASVLKAVTYVMQHPGCRGMMTIPEWSDWDKTLKPTLDDLFGDVEGRFWSFEVKPRILHFPAYKAQVFVRPALEYNSLRGPTLAFASMDEVGTDNQWPAYKILDAAVSQPGFPHQLWVTSTPNVGHPWLKSLWKDHINPESGEPVYDPEDFPIFEGETKDNFYLDDTYIRSQYAMYEGTRWGDQELRGRFIAVSGIAFPDFDPRVHVKAPPADQLFKRTVYGIDFGASSPTAIYRLQQDDSNRIWVTDEYYKRNAEIEDWVKYLGTEGATRVECDPSISQDQAQHYARVYGIRFAPAMKMRRFIDRYNFWSSHLAQGEFGPKLFIAPNCRNLIAELQNLAFPESRAGFLKDDGWAPGCADHAYDAVAYAGLAFLRPFGMPNVSIVRHSFA